MSNNNNNELFIINLATFGAKGILSPLAASRKTLVSILDGIQNYNHNMKNFLLYMLAMIVSVKSFSQSNALSAQNDTLLAYNETVRVDGVLKNELFIRARDWLSNNCKNLKIQDKELGELSGSGTATGKLTIHFLGEHTGLATFDFTINIFVKDGIYKYIITNIENTKVNGTAANGVLGMLYISKHCTVQGIPLSQKKLDEAYQSVKDGFDKTEKELVGFLKSSMQNKSTPDF